MILSTLAPFLKSLQGAFTYERPQQPFIHTYVWHHSTISVPLLISQLRKEQILVDSMDRSYLSTFQKDNLLKLNVTNVGEQHIEKGIERIGILLTQSVRLS